MRIRPFGGPRNDPHKDIARKLTVQPELFLVSVEQDHIIGTVMAGYEGHRGWVNYLAVAPAFRGRGLARALMEHVERELVAIGSYRHLGYVEDESVSLGKRLMAD